MNMARGRGGKADSHRELSIDSARCWVAGGKKTEIRGGDKLRHEERIEQRHGEEFKETRERQTGEEQREAEVEATREKLIERKREYIELQLPPLHGRTQLRQRLAAVFM